MSPITVTIIASFLLAFKSILVEGSEIVILSLATVSQLGKRNVLFGVILGIGGSLIIFAVVRQVFLLLPEVVIDLLAAVILFYFSSKFLRGFVKYYFGKKSFREKMTRLSKEIVAKGLEQSKVDSPTSVISFSFVNSLPVFAITLNEGFEASIVLGAAGAFNLEWTGIGAALSILVLIVVAIASYDYLIRFPRWLLDLIAGVVLFSFAAYFLGSGLLVQFGGGS